MITKTINLPAAYPLQKQIEDDGQGFEPDSVLTPAGGRKAWGLVGMQERASLVGGQFDIMSAHGRGTVVTVIVPVEEP